ncbi:unnamed protein product [Cylindrotheca closterium]|uniref:Uncharacterized protein n=1 Tax=Cylindrotheca closterium TaxID=2856 RepID=A0AAD2G4W8_9STRA|nr:unnamed protein product [Cylindrotheca closterium]
MDDKSTKVGGQQRLTTPDGFVLPLDIRNGLSYLRMRPPTDRELSNPDIPHVELTSDTDWDPSVLDHNWKNGQTLFPTAILRMKNACLILQELLRIIKLLLLLRILN